MRRSSPLQPAVHLHVGRIVIDADPAEAIHDARGMARQIRMHLESGDVRGNEGALGQRIADALRPLIDTALGRGGPPHGDG
jgi:hypothetical protein